MTITFTFLQLLYIGCPIIFLATWGALNIVQVVILEPIYRARSKKRYEKLMAEFDLRMKNHDNT